MSTPTFDQLLEAGCHFGHLKRKWNPAMAPYIFMERNGIHILDLYKTAAKVEEAAAALKSIAKAGKKVLFVATKKQAKQVTADKAKSVGMPYVIERWPGGMLTNFPTIRKAVKKMASIDKMTKDGTFANIDFVIPANDDASKSIELILDTVCSAMAEGLEERKVEKVDTKEEDKEAAPRRERRRPVRRAEGEAEAAPAAEAEAAPEAEAAE